jgi:hypothetical protein
MTNMSLIEKPLIVDTNRLRPIPKDLFPDGQLIPCSSCNYPRARWAFMDVESKEGDDPVPVCSRCFLYESGWGEVRQDELKTYIAELVKETKRPFDLDENQVLKNDKDCDAVLGAITLFSRMMELRTAQYDEAQAKKDASKIILPGSSQFGIR